MAVRIRMQQLGRMHRHFYRIVAIDHRQPREGRALEILGTYDPAIKEKEERVRLNPDRIKYWLSVGAKPSEHVAIFLKKYMTKFEEMAASEAAVANLVAAQRARGETPEGATTTDSPAAEPAAAEPAATEPASTEDAAGS